MLCSQACARCPILIWAGNWRRAATWSSSITFREPNFFPIRRKEKNGSTRHFPARFFTYSIWLGDTPRCLAWRDWVGGHSGVLVERRGKADRPFFVPFRSRHLVSAGF